MEKADSFEEIVAWYKMGHRDFRGTNLQMVDAPPFEKLDLRGIKLGKSYRLTAKAEALRATLQKEKGV